MALPVERVLAWGYSGLGEPSGAGMETSLVLVTSALSISISKISSLGADKSIGL